MCARVSAQVSPVEIAAQNEKQLFAIGFSRDRIQILRIIEVRLPDKILVVWVGGGFRSRQQIQHACPTKRCNIDEENRPIPARQPSEHVLVGSHEAIAKRMNTKDEGCRCDGEQRQK